MKNPAITLYKHVDGKKTPPELIHARFRNAPALAWVYAKMASRKPFFVLGWAVAVYFSA